MDLHSQIMARELTISQICVFSQAESVNASCIKSDLAKSFFFSPFLFFLWLHLGHIEVPRLGVKSELQRQVYATAMATLDPSQICNVCHSLQQC